MKKKHLKLGSCALMASLLTLSSCVDNDYDLTKEEFYKLKYCSTVVYMVPRA